VETIRLKHQRHSYANGAGVLCTLGIEVSRTKGFVEVRRVRSDGRRIVKMILTLEEADELKAALAKALEET
jgi:hypothetical protein